MRVRWRRADRPDQIRSSIEAKRVPYNFRVNDRIVRQYEIGATTTTQQRDDVAVWSAGGWGVTLSIGSMEGRIWQPKGGRGNPGILKVQLGRRRRGTNIL